MAGTDDCVNRRPLEGYVDGLKYEISKRLLGGQPVRPNSSWDIIAAVFGAAQFETAGDLAGLRDQLFVTTMCCDSLDRYAASFGLRKRPATKARGYVTIDGNPGTLIPAGLEFTAPSGIEYALDPTPANPTVLGHDGKATLLIRAKLPGLSGNYMVQENDVGTMQLSISSSGIDQVAQVPPCGLAGGVDDETCEDLRQRLIDRRKNAVVAGNLAFYEAAIKDFPGVKRVCFSGCKCNDCKCGPVITAYPFFDKAVYPPYGVPPQMVLDDILTTVFGENNGAGDGLAPVGAMGQILAACPTSLSVNIYTVTNVGPELADVVTKAVEEFFDTITCVGERFCKASLIQAIMAATPSICVRDVFVCGDGVTEADEMIKIPCGHFPAVDRVRIQARRPPDDPCAE